MKAVYVQSLMRTPTKNVNLPKFQNNFQKRFTNEDLDLTKYLNNGNESLIQSSDEDDNGSITFDEE
jgi:hypothetical protein